VLRNHDFLINIDVDGKGESVVFAMYGTWDCLHGEFDFSVLLSC